MKSNTQSKRAKLKTFDVAYYLEQGFSISVKSSSAQNAERIVRRRLNDAMCELSGSERVHYNDDIVGVEEVKP